jgi:ABC-type multidrug transport system ATPase subunit
MKHSSGNEDNQDVFTRSNKDKNNNYLMDRHSIQLDNGHTFRYRSPRTKSDKQRNDQTFSINMNSTLVNYNLPTKAGLENQNLEETKDISPNDSEVSSFTASDADESYSRGGILAKSVISESSDGVDEKFNSSTFHLSIGKRIDQPLGKVYEHSKVGIAFRNINVSANYFSWSSFKTEKKKLLKDVTAYIPPHTLTYIMGPSGSGKTTLLNTLAVRNQGSSVKGDIVYIKEMSNHLKKKNSSFMTNKLFKKRIDHTKDQSLSKSRETLDSDSTAEVNQSENLSNSSSSTIGPKNEHPKLRNCQLNNLSANKETYVEFKSKTNVGYVQQEDHLMGMLTARENLMFSSNLRLPPSLSKEAKEARVDHVIDLLHLQKCAHTKIGTSFIRGVSGGERKRISVGMELVTDPQVL